MRVNTLAVFILPILAGESHLNRRGAPESARAPAWPAWAAWPETGILEGVTELAKVASPLIEEMAKIDVADKLNGLIDFIANLKKLGGGNGNNGYGSVKPGKGGYKTPPTKYPTKPIKPPKYYPAPPPTPEYPPVPPPPPPQYDTAPYPPPEY